MERTQNPVPDPVALQEAGEVESGWVLGWGVGCGKGSGPGEQSVGRVAGEGSPGISSSGLWAAVGPQTGTAFVFKNT